MEVVGLIIFLFLFYIHYWILWDYFLYLRKHPIS